MKKRIDSTFYFFQYLGWRIMIIAAFGFLIYNLVSKDVQGIIASLIFTCFTIYFSKKLFPKPTDLKFDHQHLYLDKQSAPIEIKNIKAIENGVIISELEGQTTKYSLPRYYFIDKNYKKLKITIEKLNQ